MIIPTKKATMAEMRKLPGPMRWACIKERLPLYGGVKTQTTVRENNIANCPMYRTHSLAETPIFEANLVMV